MGQIEIDALFFHNLIFGIFTPQNHISANFHQQAIEMKSVLKPLSIILLSIILLAELVSSQPDAAHNALEGELKKSATRRLRTVSSSNRPRERSALKIPPPRHKISSSPSTNTLLTEGVPTPTMAPNRNTYPCSSKYPVQTVVPKVPFEEPAESHETNIPSMTPSATESSTNPSSKGPSLAPSMRATPITELITTEAPNISSEEAASTPKLTGTRERDSGSSSLSVCSTSNHGMTILAIVLINFI